jgi:hypothetical protein
MWEGIDAGLETERQTERERERRFTGSGGTALSLMGIK